MAALGPAPVRADDSLARLQQKSATAISGLTWKSQDVLIEPRRDGQDIKVYAIIEGRYPKPEWSLLSHQRKIGLSSQGRFRIAIPLAGKTTPIALTAIGIRGEVESEQLEISFPTYDAYVKEQKEAGTHRLHFTPGANFSFITYHDTRLPTGFGVDSYTEKAITAKVGLSYLLKPPRLTLEAGGYFTLLPISKNIDITARFLGVNLRIGYLIPAVKDPWSLSIQGGLYYTTMFVQNDAFGFVNMAGPQLFPVVHRRLKNNDAISVYGKISPVTTANAGSFFSNRELATGGAYTHTMKNGHSISGTIDASSFQLYFADGVTISSSTFSLGVSYGL